MPQLLRRWRVKKMTYEEEYSPKERERDGIVRQDAEALGVEVTSSHGFMLYHPERLMEEADGEAPVSMGSFLKLIEKIGDPARPVEFGGESSISLTECANEVESGDESMGYFEVPEVTEFGHEEKNDGWEVFQGGEEEGLKRMEKFLLRDGGKAVASFSKPDTNPAALWPRETTVLSPYLALGCLSSRLFFEKVGEVENRLGTGDRMPQSTLWGQLMWREHFWMLAFATQNFHCMKGNHLCRVIDWDEDDEASKRLKAWEEGKTGYPWIDALMTQLKEEGFVHHLGRHSLACFLTRGDLWVSWEEGYKVFEKYLVDYDYALNSANWMWLSCSAFFVMYYRVYSPVAFAKKWDKEGKFIKHYLPVLKKMPKKYIYEPWKAPISVQKSAGCVVGTDYPKPIVNHTNVSKENIGRMKKAYERHEFGAPEPRHANEASTNSRNDNRRGSPEQNKSATKRRKTESS